MSRRTKAEMAALRAAWRAAGAAKEAEQHAAELAAAKAIDDHYRARLVNRALPDRARWLPVWLRKFPQRRVSE